MTTYDDILAARAEREAAAQSAKDAIHESFGSSKPRQQTSNELTPRKSGKFGEGLKIWAAKENAKAGIASLAEAIMRNDKSKGIYAAEADAKAFAEQAYILAATKSPYEDVRQESVAAAVTLRSKTLSSTVNGG